MVSEQMKEYIKNHSEELYELLLKLAVIPAPSGQEERRADFCLKWLKAQGAQGVYTDRAGNVIYPYHVTVPDVWDEGSNAGKMPEIRQGELNGAVVQANHQEKSNDIKLPKEQPLIVFIAHMDVVFPDLTELPLQERDGRIYCPGVGDDTANLAVMLMTAKYMAQYQPDTGKYGLLFVCGTGEEGLGNLKGSREICAAFGKQIEAFYALDLTMEAYTARAVGSLRYRVTVEAQGGHSYHCFGNTNANVILAKLITSLYRIKVPERGKTTYNVGVISGGTSVNTIAQHAEMLYEIRSDEEADMQELEELFLETVAALPSGREAGPSPVLHKFSADSNLEISQGDYHISVEEIGERPCERNVDPEKRQKLFWYVEEAVESATGLRPYPVPCSTDCNIPLSMGIPSVCVGTYRGAGAHTREEYIEKDSLADGLMIALTLADNYCRRSKDGLT